MYWIEAGNDGSYVFEGQEYPLLSEGIEELEGYEGERSGNDWAKVVHCFQLETEHGVFGWEVELIEYLELNVTSFLGYSITEFPSNVLLKDEVTFHIQDGWAYPREPALDLKRRTTKMRLV